MLLLPPPPLTLGPPFQIWALVAEAGGLGHRDPPFPPPQEKGSKCWICNRYGAPVWILPFPDVAGEAAAADRDLMSPVVCRNNPLQLKTCAEPLGAKIRVLWIIGHNVLLSRALWPRWYLEVPFLLCLQPVSMPFWLRWKGSVKCFVGLGPGSETKDTVLLTGGFFEETIYCTANESRTQNSSTWYRRECLFFLGLISKRVDATFAWNYANSVTRYLCKLLVLVTGAMYALQSIDLLPWFQYFREKKGWWWGHPAGEFQLGVKHECSTFRYNL